MSHDPPSDSRHSCPNCKTPLTPAQVTCKRGHDCGSINVRIARRPDEVAELDRRYQESLDDARQRGVQHVAQAFEEALRQRSQAVVNTHPGFVKRLGKENGFQYLNYYERQREGMDAEPSDKVFINRVMGDAFAYPQYGDKLRFAALALGPLGLPSYGPVSMVLKTDLLNDRAAVLERNSYHFLAGHYCISPPTAADPFPVSEPPLGYRADWQNRHKLAVAKHGGQLAAGMTGDDFDALVLVPGSGRGVDVFLEVGIFDPFGVEDVLEIHAPRNLGGEDQDILEDAADRMAAKHVDWCWYDC